MGAGVVVGANVDGASVVLFAASATHRSRRIRRGAMLASQCWSAHAVKQGCFASRARHAAAALLPPIASIYVGAGAAAKSLGSALSPALSAAVRG